MNDVCYWDEYEIPDLEDKGIVSLGRGNIISKIDIQEKPGGYPIYSSSAKKDGMFGKYGDYMFDEEMITWSIDGGGTLFYRPRHKFSVTNVCGYMRLDTSVLDYRFVHAALCLQHSRITFDYQTKAHPSVIRNLYRIPIPPLPEQKKIAEILSGIDKAMMAMQRRIDKIATAQEGLANSWQERISLDKEEGTLGELLDSIDSGWSPSCEELPPQSGEWGVLKVSAVTKGYFCENESKRLPSDLQPREQHLVRKNDLLITRANGNLDLVGRGAIVQKEPAAKLLMSDKILRLNPNISADRNFLLLLLNSRSVRRQIETAVGGSTGAKNIGQSLLKQIVIAIPASSDQERIGNLSHSFAATMSAAQKRLHYLISLKKGLSADLLSGRKRVSV